MDGKGIWFVACLVLMAVSGIGASLIWNNYGITQAVEVGIAAVWLFGVPRALPRVRRFVQR
jgi:hypothetical protein